MSAATDALRRQRRLRKIEIAITVFAMADLILNVLTGSFMVVLPVIILALMAYSLRVNVRTVRLIQRTHRPWPDYSAIAAMEREIYGETFEHEGAPKPVRTVSGPHGSPAAAQACWHCGDRARIRGLCLPCSKMLKGWGIERTICPQGHPDRRWVEGRGEVCPTCDDSRNARSNLRWN